MAQDRTGSTALTPGETHLGPDTGDGDMCKGLGVRVQRLGFGVRVQSLGLGFRVWG